MKRERERERERERGDRDSERERKVRNKGKRCLDARVPELGTWLQQQRTPRLASSGLVFLGKREKGE